jgi:DNA repair exonuclease SbcCD ATPase subunit
VVEARQALETLRAEVTAKQRLLIRDCRDKQRELSVIEHELTTLERRMRALEQLMGSAPPTALASLLHTWARLQTNASELRLKQADATSFFLTLDDTFWNTMGRDIARPSGVPKSLPGSPIAEHPN